MRKYFVEEKNESLIFFFQAPGRTPLEKRGCTATAAAESARCPQKHPTLSLPEGRTVSRWDGICSVGRYRAKYSVGRISPAKEPLPPENGGISSTDPSIDRALVHIQLFKSLCHFFFQLRRFFAVDPLSRHDHDQLALF